MHFTNGFIKFLTAWKKKETKQKPKKHFEFEAEQPQFSTLIQYVQSGCFSFLCAHKECVCVCVFFFLFKDTKITLQKYPTRWENTMNKLFTTACQIWNKQIKWVMPQLMLAIVVHEKDKKNWSCAVLSVTLSVWKHEGWMTNKTATGLPQYGWGAEHHREKDTELWKEE